MNKKVLYVYALIMLECRLSLEDASILFKIEKETLRKELSDLNNVSFEISKAIYYLTNFEAIHKFSDTKKNLFKAECYLNRFYKIIKIKNKQERHNLLKSFIGSLKGENILLTSPGVSYTPEEKMNIIKYRLKYALTGKDIEYISNIKHSTILEFENSITDENLKKRIEIFHDYLNNEFYYLKRNYHYLNGIIPKSSLTKK